MDELSHTFGRELGPNERRIEKRRLAVFLAIGAAFFLLAIVGAAFVPLRWPNLVRRAGHSVIFVPLIYWLTIRMLRGDRSAAPSVPAFDPRPIARASMVWFLGGAALIGAITLVFVWLFGLHWVVNPGVGAGALLLMLLDIALIAAAEEIAFRGYALWRLIRLIGMWPAQIVVALALRCRISRSADTRSSLRSSVR